MTRDKSFWTLLVVFQAIFIRPILAGRDTWYLPNTFHWRPIEVTTRTGG